MSRRIPEETIQEIRDRTDIVAVVESYLPLKRSGANHQGLCPFHSEKTPSFNVNSTRQIFHCFGCGVGGNVFSFLMKMEGLSFPEAVRRLGENVGVEIPEEEVSPAEEKRREELATLARINDVAAEFYHQMLVEADEGAPARRYLRQRGYDAETVRTYRLGYAPERWESLTNHLQQKGFDLRLVREKTGLVRAGKEGRGDYDLFRKRLLIPIHDLRGQVVAFGGRVLDDSLPKYINSPESPLYNKSGILFGLDRAREAMRREGCGIIVEGYFDQMALHRAGIAHAAATCGTALTAEHGKLLKRYTDRVLLLFDQDRAGQQATFRAMDVLLPEGLSVAVVELGAGHDPDSFLAAKGPDALATRLEAARPVIDYFTDVALGESGEGVEGTARAVEEVVAKLRLLKSDIERDLYLRKLAERTGLDESLLRRKSGAGAPRPQPPRPAPPAKTEAAKTTRKSPEEKAQDWVVGLMVENESIRDRVIADGLDHYFTDPLHRAIAEKVSSIAVSGEGLDFDRLQNRLDDTEIRLLSGILLKEKDALAVDPEAIFEDCRQRLSKVRDRQRYRELQMRLRDPAVTLSEEELEEFQILKKKL